MAELRARGDAFVEVAELIAYGPMRRLERLSPRAASGDVEAHKASRAGVSHGEYGNQLVLHDEAGRSANSLDLIWLPGDGRSFCGASARPVTAAAPVPAAGAGGRVAEPIAKTSARPPAAAVPRSSEPEPARGSVTWRSTGHGSSLQPPPARWLLVLHAQNAISQQFVVHRELVDRRRHPAPLVDQILTSGS